MHALTWRVTKQLAAVGEREQKQALERSRADRDEVCTHAAMTAAQCLIRQCVCRRLGESGLSWGCDKTQTTSEPSLPRHKKKHCHPCLRCPQSSKKLDSNFQTPNESLLLPWHETRPCKYVEIHVDERVAVLNACCCSGGDRALEGVIGGITRATP